MSGPITMEHIGKTVSFDVYPTAILGSTFRNVKLTAILDAEEASKYIAVARLSANVYPTLPAGSIKDPNTYQFLKVVMADGRATAVAIPWIDLSTFEIQQHINVNFTVENAGSEDAERIRKILSSNGYTSVNYYIN